MALENLLESLGYGISASVNNAVDALLNGKEVQQTETKAIGCSIKV